MNDQFLLECAGLPAGARVLAFDGIEEISTTYRYEVDVLVDPDADLGDAVGAPATLTIHPDGEQTLVHGVVGSATVIDHLEDHDLYRVVLVPRVKDLLGHDRHSRVFVGEAVPSILQTLLREAGLGHEDCEFRLTHEYDPIEFVCQYRENTLDFLMRWMERDGIYFHFSHDGARERMIILDDKAQHARPRVEALFLRALGATAGDGLRRFRAERRAVAGKVHVDDYDYLHPGLPVRAEAVVPGGNGGELRVRGAKVTTPKEAARIARLRTEGLRARQTVFHGEGRLLGLHTGELFTLTDHPRPPLDGDYLVTKLRIRGHDAAGLSPRTKALLGRESEPDDVLRTDLEALRSDVQFRPELRTQPPRVHSFESGVVEGDVESGYAQLDEHGRYLVKFRFDERDGRGSQASARIRMMQPHAGSPEGMHFPLRKGTEVLIAFVGGDPDRPVIAGAVPNAITPAVVRSDNATRNVIHTGGGNRIQIEDAEGSQHIHLRTPHKNTYLHLGAPFNPSYTKTTATDGTSMSYTRDVSTSLTGSDAQTLVEDSRLTVIGRSMINPADTAGTEVTTLVGPEFINLAEGDFDLAEIAADVKQTASDMQTLAAAVEKLQGLVTKPGTDLDMAAALAAVQSAMKTAASDWQTLQADAMRYDDIATQNNLQGQPGFDLGVGAAWLLDVGLLLGSISTLNDTINPPKPATPPDGPTVAKLFGTGWTSLYAAALGTDPNFVATSYTPPPGPPIFSKTGLAPVLPNPSASPTYLTIAHPSWQRTTLDPTFPPALVDDFIKNLAKQSPPQGPPLQTSDTTAMDMLDTSAYPDVLQAGPPRTAVPTPDSDTGKTGTLRPTGKAYPLNTGSDVKIVGGDNVTLARKDARSHTLGHSYGLVQAGQTSVVYAPSKFGPATVWWQQDGADKLATFTAAQNRLDQAKAALAQFEALHNPPPDPSTTDYGLYELELAALQDAVNQAQGPRDTAFAALKPLLPGNLTRPSLPLPNMWALADLAQTSTAYGNTRSWVDGGTDSTVTGDTHSHVMGTVWSQIDTDQHSTVNGTQYSTVNGDQHVTVNGIKYSLIPAMYISYTTQRMNFTTSKLAVTGIDLQAVVLALKYTQFNISMHALDTAQQAVKIDSHGVHMKSVQAAKIESTVNAIKTGLFHVNADGVVIYTG